jgi:hypothetical protein
VAAVSGAGTYTATWARDANWKMTLSGNGMTPRSFRVTPASRPDHIMLREAGLLNVPGSEWAESDTEPGTWECAVFPGSAALAVELAQGLGATGHLVS